MIYFIYYSSVLTAAAFLLMGFDKYQSKHNGLRIRERTLLLIASMGGSIGILLGMYCFHHKIRKNKFRYGIPIIFLFQILFLYKALVLIG